MNSTGVNNINKVEEFVGLKWLKQDILEYMHKKYSNRVGFENVSYEEWLSGQTILESEIRALSSYQLLTSSEVELIKEMLNQMRNEAGNEMGRALVKHNPNITPHIKPIVSDTSPNILPFVGNNNNNTSVSAEGFKQAA